MATFVKIYPQNPNEREIERIVKVLRADGVIVYPTDGVYAFGCSLFTKIDNWQFKLLKRNTPGAFTFLLEASSKVPDRALGGRKVVGVRIPDNNIPLTIVERLEFPMVTASVKDDDEIVEYTTDPELLLERYGDVVDVVIDGGYGSVVPTTLVDLTAEEPEILREGAGELN